MNTKCPLCKINQRFIPSERPKGYYICGSCGFRTSFGKKGKMIITQHGYIFKEDKMEENEELKKEEENEEEE